MIQRPWILRLPWRVCLSAAALGLLVPGSASAVPQQQSPSAPSTSSTAATPPAATPSITQPSAPSAQEVDLVKRGLSQGVFLNLKPELLRFYSRVDAKSPRTFSDYAKGYDLWNGPTKGGNPMSHQEFVNMVTPKEFYGSGGIKATELLQFAFTNWLAQTVLRRGLEELKEAKSERDAREIRERIDRELAILKASDR
jgi:hypothetical protein